MGCASEISSAPTSLCTYEPQFASDAYAMYQSVLYGDPAYQRMKVIRKSEYQRKCKVSSATGTIVILKYFAENPVWNQCFDN